jgi:pentatricopeptide repeat protein
VAAGEAEAKPNAGCSHAKPIGEIVEDIMRERDPDKLVSQFISASAASQSFREEHHRVYGVAVDRLTSFGRQDAVAAILDSQKPFLEASTEGFATRLIRLYGRASMPSHAATTFHDLPPKYKSVRTFDALLSAYVNARDCDAVATTFQQILASHPTIVPNVYSYNILIRALCRKPDLSAALDVIPLMEKCGLTPNEASFSILLNGFYNNGCFSGAEKFWEMMKERNVQPDVRCYNAKLRGLVAQGRIQDAVAVIEAMQKDGPKPDSVSYNELIRGYCKEGKLDEAKKVYDDMVNNKCAPNRGTFHTLVSHSLEAGELDLALNCCHEIFSWRCRVKCSLLKVVVTALVAASRIKEATSIVELGWENNYNPMYLNMPALIEKDKVVEAGMDCDNSVPN